MLARELDGLTLSNAKVANWQYNFKMVEQLWRDCKVFSTWPAHMKALSNHTKTVRRAFKEYNTLLHTDCN